MRKTNHTIQGSWLQPILTIAMLTAALACGGGGGGGGGGTTGSADIAPAITTNPVDLTVNAGETASFTVAASGNPSPTFTWERSNDRGSTWAAISGATNATYSFTAQFTDTAAQFRAKATNGMGTTISNAAILTVSLTTGTPGGVTLELMPIPAGTFMMGAYTGEQDSNGYERPEHQVTISQPFYLGKFEVTQAQWLAVMGNNPSFFSIAGGGSTTENLTRPVEQVSWNDIQVFLTTLNAATTTIRPAGQVFHLPTEAEWEYACRGNAPTKTRFYWGDDPSCTGIADNAWYYSNSGNTTHGTGDLKSPNAFQLYNMSGNVWEWCQDWYGPYTAGTQTDPIGPTSGSDKIIRGGSIENSGFDCRSAKHSYCAPNERYRGCGFRLVLGSNPDANCTPDGTHACPFPIAAFPFSATGDTSTVTTRDFDVYSCSAVDESGPEIVYSFTVDRSGTLTASLGEGPGVDLDVYLLSADDPTTCLARGDHTLSRALDPGRYYLIVDTNATGGVEHVGSYRLDVSFE